MTFEEYLEGRGAWLTGFTRALCGQRELAEDVLQEVLLRAHRHWDRIGGLDHPDAYLRRMLVNEQLSWRRRAARQLLRNDLQPAATAPDPALRSADHAEVSALLAALPPRQRTAVVLRFYSDLSDTDIAEAMRCSPGTVRGYLSRAMAAMRVDLLAQSSAGTPERMELKP